MRLKTFNWTPCHPLPHFQPHKVVVVFILREIWGIKLINYLITFPGPLIFVSRVNNKLLHIFVLSRTNRDRTVLSSHPLLSGRLSKSRICFRFIIVFSPLLSGRLYRADVITFEWVPTACFYCPPPALNGHFKVSIIFQIILIHVFLPKLK